MPLILNFLNMLDKFTLLASGFVEKGGINDLPPYMALGLTWLLQSVKWPFLSQQEYASLVWQLHLLVPPQ